MDEQTFTFAVETTAEITMLRQAVAFLFAQHLVNLPERERGALLDDFAREVGDMPPADLPTAEATQFHEAVAAALPERAVSFAEELRAVLAGLPKAR